MDDMLARKLESAYTKANSAPLKVIRKHAMGYNAIHWKTADFVGIGICRTGHICGGNELFLY